MVLVLALVPWPEPVALPALCQSLVLAPYRSLGLALYA
jgi:hypothetical protein